MFEVVKNKLCTERSKFAKDGRLKWEKEVTTTKTSVGVVAKFSFLGWVFSWCAARAT